MWVANSSTLIQGERDAVLVDTLLTTEQSKTLLDWVGRQRQEPHRDLYHPRPRRSFLWPRIASGAFPARQAGRDAGGRQGHARASLAGVDRQLLASPFSRRYSGPKAVIAAHKVPENDDDPHIIVETRQYLCDFNRLNAATATARELYDAMLEIYPDRVNPGSLWGAANAAEKAASSAAMSR